MMKTIYRINSDPRLEKEVESRLSKIEATTILDIGLAASRPEVQVESILSEMDASMDEVAAYVQHYCQPRASQLQVAADKFELNKLQQETGKELDPIRREMNTYKTDLDRINLDYDWDKLFMPWLGILFCTGTDAMLNYESLQVIGSSLAISLVMTLIIAGALAVGAHALGQKLQELADSRTRWKWLMAGLMGVGTVFLMLGLLRHEFYGAESGWLASPVLWVVWNLFFFGAATFVSYKYLPNKRQRTERAAYLNKLKKYRTLERQMQALKLQLKRAEKAHTKLLAQLGSWIAYEQDLLKRIEKRRHKIWATAMKEYQLKGGAGPHGFNHSIPSR